MRIFVLIWSGQLASVMGTYLTSFALGVWAIQKNGQATDYALVLLCALVPNIFLSPFAGTIVDRSNRRHVMIAADSIAAAGTGILCVLLLLDELALWQILLITLLSSAANAFQQPAYSAAVAQLVPKDKLPRANGMIQAADGIGQLLSPVLAAVLLGMIGLVGVILIDLGSFLIAVFTLCRVRIPDLGEIPQSKAGQGVKAILRRTRDDLAAGFRFLLPRRGMIYLLGFYRALQLHDSRDDCACCAPGPLFFHRGGSRHPQPHLRARGPVGNLALKCLARTQATHTACLERPIPRRTCRGRSRPHHPDPLAGPFCLFLLHGEPHHRRRNPDHLAAQSAPSSSGSHPRYPNHDYLVRHADCLPQCPVPLADQVFEPMLTEGGASGIFHRRHRRHRAGPWHRRPLTHARDPCGDTHRPGNLLANPALPGDRSSRCKPGNHNPSNTLTSGGTMTYQWGDIDRAGTQDHFFVDYLDKASALEQTKAYKQKTYLMLGLKPGDHVLDVGCGAGDDLLSLANMVGPSGRVTGIDNSQVMVETAQRRSEHLDWVKAERGDGNAIPFPDSSFDACRADRVFIHLQEPEMALDEMLRVLRPGGRILIADPEYDSLMLDAQPAEITRAVVRHLTDENRNPFAARHNFRLFRRKNLQKLEVWPSTAVFHDLEAADQILGFRDAASALVKAGIFLETEAEAWKANLETRNREKLFLCAMTGLATVAQKPDLDEGDRHA